jgi:hypothetical protein
MTLSITIILGIISIICLLGGLNILLKGAGYFLPKETPPQIVLDNVVRFMAGIYFGMGFLVAWTALHLDQIHDLVYLLGIVVFCSGLGRLYSRIKMGSGGMYLFAMMCLEIVLGGTLILLQYYR